MERWSRGTRISAWLSDCWRVDLRDGSFSGERAGHKGNLSLWRRVYPVLTMYRMRLKTRWPGQSRTFSRTAWMRVFLSLLLNFDLHDLKHGLEAFVGSLCSPLPNFPMGPEWNKSFSTFLSFNWRLVERWPDLTGHKLWPPSHLLESSLEHNKNKTKTLVPLFKRGRENLKTTWLDLLCY